MTVQLAAERQAAVSARSRPGDALLRRAVDAAGWATVVVAVALWATGPGSAEAWSSTANALTALGRLCGLLAANLLLLQVLLMSRVPLLERVCGRDHLVRRHRVVGFASFVLLWVHVGFVTSGYSALVDANWARQSWDLVANYPGMLLAAAGTAALTLVTITSIRIARRRLRYESWHLLHLYAYLGVGLALPHQIWAGADFVSSPAARAYWLTLYGLAAGAVLTYRVGLPAARTFRHQVSVLSVDREAPDVVSVHLAGRDLHRLRARAGQYFLWRFLDGPGWSRGHPYSLSSAPRGNRVRITARSGSETGARLAALRPGTWVQFEGPYGRMTGQRRSGSALACFAGGIGITPLRALLEELAYGPGEAVLVYRASAADDLVFRAELDALAAARGLVVHYLVGRRAGDGSWLPAGVAAGGDAEAMRDLVPDLDDADLFVCGPQGWADAVCAAARAAGVLPSRVHTERFAW